MARTSCDRQELAPAYLTVYCSHYDFYTVPQFTGIQLSESYHPSAFLFLVGGDRLLGEYPDKWV